MLSPYLHKSLTRSVLEIGASVLRMQCLSSYIRKLSYSTIQITDYFQQYWRPFFLSFQTGNRQARYLRMNILLLVLGCVVNAQEFSDVKEMMEFNVARWKLRYRISDIRFWYRILDIRYRILHILSQISDGGSRCGCIWCHARGLAFKVNSWQDFSWFLHICFQF